MEVFDASTLPLLPGSPDTKQDVEHRRPYESLLLCWPAHLPPPPSAADPEACSGSHSGGGGGGNGSDDGFHLLQGRPMVVAAVPPASHSRKPHLGALLQPLLPPGARCLEVGYLSTCCCGAFGAHCLPALTPVVIFSCS